MMSKFINDLRIDLKKEIFLYSLDSIREAYHKILEIEKFHKTSAQRRDPFPDDSGQSRSTPINCMRNIVQPVLSRTRPHPTVTKIREPTLMVSQSTSSSNIECHFYYGKDHIAARCPRCTLIMEKECEETLSENILEDFNPLELAILEKEYGKNYEEPGG